MSRRGNPEKEKKNSSVIFVGENATCFEKRTKNNNYTSGGTARRVQTESGTLSKSLALAMSPSNLGS